MKRILLIIVAFCVLMIIGFAVFNSEFHSVDEEYRYEDFLSDIQSQSVTVIQMALSNAPSRFEGDPRVTKIIKAIWNEDELNGIKFDKAATHPIVKIQASEALLSMREAPRKAYVDYIYLNLSSNDFEQKRTAVRALGTVFDNEAVRKLKKIISDQPELANVAVGELERMAVAAHSSENLALEVIKDLISFSGTSETIRKITKEAFERVKATNERFGAGVRILTEPISSGNSYPELYPFLEEDKRRVLSPNGSDQSN